MSGASQEPTSIWDNIVSKRNTLLSFLYKDQHLSVWKHRNAQSEMDEYYVTPVPRLIPGTVQCLPKSIWSDSSKLVFQVEMWSHAIQDAAIDAIQEHIGLRPTRFQVHPLPFQKIRLTHRSGHGRVDAAIQLDSTWLTNTQEKIQHQFFFFADSHEICAKAEKEIANNPKSLADELILEALLTAEAHSSRTLSVQSRHITTSKLFASLDSMDTKGITRYLRSQDVNKMAQQIASQVIATEISDVDYIPAEDELSLKELINRQLKAAKETTDKFTEDQWESVFWDPAFARPDKITDFLQNTVTYDEGSKNFSWDESKANEWAQTNKTDLKKMSQHFNHQESDVQKDISGSAAAKLTAAPKLFDMNISGAYKDTEKKKSSSKNKSNESNLEEGSEQRKDCVELSKDEMNSWLKKNNVGVCVQGEMFRTKPMELCRLNLRDLEQMGELLTKRVQVHRVNVETKFQVGIKTDREEEAETMRKMLTETKAEIAQLKSNLYKLSDTSVAMKEDFKMRLKEKANQLKSSVTAVKVELDEKVSKHDLEEEMAKLKADLNEKPSEANIIDLEMKISNIEEEAKSAIQKLKRTYYSIVLIGGEDSTRSAEWFYPWDPSRNRLLTTPLPTPKRSHISAVLDTAGTVLIAGGWNEEKKVPLSSALLLDPIRESWTFVKSMNIVRDTAGSAVVDGVVYVCGGGDGRKRTNSCECFRSGVWEPIAPMSQARSALALVALNGKLYAIGGKDPKSLSVVEAYDIQTDTWTQNASMPNPQSFLGTAVLGKSIIVCGGQEGSGRECLKYDVEVDRWMTIAQMNQRRSHFSVVALGDHLVALGGKDDSAQFTAELYDPEKNEWTLLNAKFKQPRCRHSANLFMLCSASM